MNLTQGTVVDRYTVERIVGRGGMGRVYRVRHNVLGSTHALKVIANDEPYEQARLMKEGQFQASLRHPGIVSVTDVIRVGDFSGLIMEFVDGPSLFKFAKLYTFTVPELSTFGSRLLQAVAAAHAHGLVHRDLKPGNILISRLNDDIFPRICDFGIAKALEPADGSAALTDTGMILGTPSYMAPEQYRNSKNVDERADLFSIGVLLYMLIAKRKPFKGENPVEIYEKMSKARYPKLKASENLPQRFIDAIDTALEPDLNLRVASARRLCRIWEVGGKGAKRDSAPATLSHSWNTFPGYTNLLATQNDVAFAPTLDPIEEVTTKLLWPGDPNFSRTFSTPTSLRTVSITAALTVCATLGVFWLTWDNASTTEVPIAAPQLLLSPAPSVEAASEVIPVDKASESTSKESPSPSELRQAPPPEPTASVSQPRPTPPEPAPEKVTPAAPEGSVPTAAPLTGPAHDKISKTAEIIVANDSAQIWLRNSTGSYRAGTVPAGTYQFIIEFPDSAPISAGEITLRAGEKRTLNCVVSLRACR